MTKQRSIVAVLDKRVSLQSLTSTPDGAGGFSSSWQTVSTVWAHVEPLAANSAYGGGEYSEARQIAYRQRVRITLRYITGVTADMRVVMGSQLFNIRQVINQDMQNRVLEIIAEEGVAL